MPYLFTLELYGIGECAFEIGHLDYVSMSDTTCGARIIVDDDGTNRTMHHSVEFGHCKWTFAYHAKRTGHIGDGFFEGVQPSPFFPDSYTMPRGTLVSLSEEHATAQFEALLL